VLDRLMEATWPPGGVRAFDRRLGLWKRGQVKRGRWRRSAGLPQQLPSRSVQPPWRPPAVASWRRPPRDKENRKWGLASQSRRNRKRLWPSRDQEPREIT
jgi:hypothetical protein